MLIGYRGTIIGRDFIVKCAEKFSEHNAKISPEKFLTVTEK